MIQIKQNKNVLLFGFILFLTITFSAIGFSRQTGNSETKNPLPMSPETIAAGKLVFFDYCAGCHGRRADGRGPQALNLNPKPQNLRNPQFAKYLTDERLYTSVSGGVRGTSMPAFEMMISTEKRWQVINYIRSLTADDKIDLPNSLSYQNVSSKLKNPLELTDESITTGRSLFLNYCANCHGLKADGKGIIAPNLIPAPRNLIVITSWGEKPFIDYLSDARIYDSITNGVPGTSMLPWIEVMSDEERWHIINYLRSEGAKHTEEIEQMYQ